LSDPRQLAAWRGYFIPGTEVLRNKLGATDARALEEAERKITALALPDLRANPPPLTPEGHCEVHRRLFGEIYTWAGGFRDVVLQKEGTRFVEPQRIAAALAESYAQLRAEHNLAGTSRERFVDRAALYLAQWNLVHPFREGNGRTQRIMLQALGREAGHPLDFRSVSAERMIQASIEAADARAPKLEGLRAIIGEAADPARLAVFDKMRPVLDALRRNGHFDWNKADIAVARPGERLYGVATLPREADGVFMLRIAGDRLVIATTAPGQKMPEAGRRVSHIEPEQGLWSAKALSKEAVVRSALPLNMARQRDEVRSRRADQDRER
jgi:cell filamentation protein